MTRPSLCRLTDTLATAFIYCAACALVVALDGVLHVRRWLGRSAP